VDARDAVCIRHGAEKGERVSEPTITELNRLIYDLTVRAEQAERSLAEKESEIEQLAEDYQGLGQERYEQMEDLRATLSDTLDKLAESAQDIGQLRATLARLEGERNGFNALARAEALLKETLTAERDGLLEKVARVEGERDRAQDEITIYEGECAHLNGMLILAESKESDQDAEISRLTAERDGLRAALEWALGERDEFPPRQDGEGAFWWRKELRRRADLGRPNE